MLLLDQDINNCKKTSDQLITSRKRTAYTPVQLLQVCLPVTIIMLSSV